MAASLPPPGVAHQEHTEAPPALSSGHALPDPLRRLDLSGPRDSTSIPYDTRDYSRVATSGSASIRLQ